MGKYNNKGSYAGYDKNNKEREALDYYATPPREVTNILETYYKDLNVLKNSIILEPSCGGGHMVEGILNTCDEEMYIDATDIKSRENLYIPSHFERGVNYHYGEEYDFLSDNYPFDAANIVIMNPPFKVAIPFILHGLEIARNQLIVLGRTKLVESQQRYNEIFKNNPPTHIYQYIDRIACAKNGDFTQKLSSIESYAWFIWDKEDDSSDTKFHWIWSKK